jgi:peptidoglycan/LPS O-acetylase OafA/YrhL
LIIVFIEILLIVAIGALFVFIDTHYPDTVDYLSQYLSQTRLSQVGAVLIVVVGCFLYFVREKWRLAYGLLELAFAAVYGFFALQKVGGQRGYVETLSIVAAVYLVVRGVDNIATGWKARRERLDQQRQRLREFIDSGKQ